MAVSLSPAEFDYQLKHIDQSRSASIIAANIVLPLIATVFVVLRGVAEKTKGASWHLDDSVIVASLLATSILCIESILGAHFGLGHHLLHVIRSHPGNPTDVFKVQFAIELTWSFCTYLVKLSNILLLARLLASPACPHIRSYFHLVHAFLFLWTTASILGIVFGCAPVQSFWDPGIGGSCPHIQAVRIVTAAFNSFTDVLLLSLSIRPVWQLHSRVRQKPAVTLVFGVGFFCLAASVARLHYSIGVTQGHGHDPTYSDAPYFLWSPVEPCAGIICACLPFLRPLSASPHVKKLTALFNRSISRIGSRREADTWWHPPPEEIEETFQALGDPESCGKRVKHDQLTLPSGGQKPGVKERLVSVTEIREGG